MQERLLPAREAIVDADRLVAVRARSLERGVDVAHLERDVVGTGAARREEAVEEPAGRAVGHDHLDRAAAGEFPLPEHEAVAGARSALAPAEVSGQQLGHGGDVGHAERDVIELGFHGALR